MNDFLFDLNDPYDARSYVAIFIAEGRLKLDVEIHRLSDTSVLELAKMLFLKVDERDPSSEDYH